MDKIKYTNKWHNLEEKVILKELKTSIKGLSSKEVKDRLLEFGLNTLPTKKAPTIFKIILNQLNNYFIIILLIAAFISIIIGDNKDALFIFIVIIINSAIGAYQEYNAEKNAASLQNMLKFKSRVLRDDKEIEIFSEKVVPGDIVILASGYKVPADIRLLDSDNLTLDESFLTGESIAEIKRVGVLPLDTIVSERDNMAYAGSIITSGRGIGVVVETGINTEVGKIAYNINNTESAKPPLISRMERFTMQISVIILLISFFLSTILYFQGYNAESIFFFFVILTVSTIPEGLPVALTIALSIAVSRMSKRNVIVRKLPAVESLGSCTVIASDKTGTLTVNQQTAKEIWLRTGEIIKISGEGYNDKGKFSLSSKEIDEETKKKVVELSEIGVLANEASLIKVNNEWVNFGDAMDVAFLAISYKLGKKPEDLEDKSNLVGIIPYESLHKFSASFYKDKDKIKVAVKGSVEKILEHCTISINEKENILKQAELMANQGYRVIAVAGGIKTNFQYKNLYEEQDLPKLTFNGLVGFIDPLRKEAKESIDRCKEAGIKVIMITGDHPGTAFTIAKELEIALNKEEVVTGVQLSEALLQDNMTFDKLVASASVFARVTPTQKLEIIDSLIRQGEFVAVTGDGVNDAPALRKANIGVSMGSGSDVAKENSDMIITDDNFNSILAGVEEGRHAYNNVRKVMYLLISTGAAEVTLFALSIFLGLPLPILAVQLLWLNLVTNGIQDVALAFEGGEKGAMKQKPRKPKEKIFNYQMVSQTIISGLTIAIITFAVWFYLIEIIMMDETSARNIILLLMVFLQNVHVFNCRSEVTSAFKIPLNKNYFLIFGVFLAQGIHILSMYIPFMQDILHVEPITAIEWFTVLALALPILIVMEIYKIINKRIIKKCDNYS